MRRQVEEEMSEDDFDEISWLMEMEAMFYGESEKAFFKYVDLEKNRVLNEAIYPNEMYEVLKSKNFKKPKKLLGEVRLISCDISGMSSKKNNNDASVYSIICLIPNKSHTAYEKRIVYMESYEGGHSTAQAIRIRKLFEEFQCDYIVIDSNGLGLGVFDQLVTNLYDTETGISYDAVSCINNEEMANRCFVEDAPKVIYSIKADAKLNSQMHVFVRDELKRGSLRLLMSENDGRGRFCEIDEFNKMPKEEQMKYLSPYVQTTLLINEMINLEQVDNQTNGLIKLIEPSTKRKDRYSSIGYGIFIAKELEQELRPKRDDSFDTSKLFRFTKQRNRLRR